jgi:diguanylate cyclase (GGDEF)-like protein/PAS domain S-box-containing protein
MDHALPPNNSINPDWRVLIIDDDERDYLLTRTMLRKARGRKINVHWASTYGAGRRELAGEPYDAILVDYDLSGPTGIEFIREAVGLGYPAPLILFTGRGGYEVDVEAMNAGATLYVTKDEANPLLLERMIRYAIEIKQKENALRDREARLEQELSERKKAEEGLLTIQAILRQSEEKFSQAFTHIPAGVIMTRLRDRTTIEVNDTWLKMFGYQRDEVIGSAITMNHWISEERRNQAAQALAQHKTVNNSEQIMQRRSGEVFYALASAEVLTIGGEEVGLTTWVDITERKQQDAAMRLRDQLIEMSYEPIIVTDTKLGIQFWNGGSERLYGYSKEEAAGCKPQELLKTIFPTSMDDTLQQLELTGQWEGELRHRSKDGREIIVQSHLEFMQIEGKRLVLESNRDITQQKQQEEKIRQSEEKFSKAFQMSSAIKSIALTDTHQLVEVNDAFLSLFECSREQVIGHTPQEIYLYADPEQAAGMIREVIERGYLYDFEIILKTRSGKLVELLTSTQFFVVDGVSYTISTSIDITNRKEAQRALRESHEEYRSLVESLDGGVGKVDENGRILFSNGHYARRMGLAPEEVVGKNLYDLLDMEQAEKSMQVIRQVISSGTGVVIEASVALKELPKKWYRSSIQPVFNNERRAVQAVISILDVTEIRRAEEQIREQAERLQNLSNELKIERDTLALRVEERTAELRQANSELQKEVEHRQQIQADLERLAITDPLTGIYNRRQIFVLGALEVTQALRYSRPLSLLMVDIDHFKSINDSFGHVTGDEVINHIVQIIQSHIRTSDILARYGGEEFLILLPETDLHNAQVVAERIRRQVDQSEIQIGEHCIHATLSLGATDLNLCKAQGGFGELLACADHSLYQAKHAGRNRTGIWIPE